MQGCNFMQIRQRIFKCFGMQIWYANSLQRCETFDVFFSSHVFLPLIVAELSTSYRSSRTYLSWMQTVLAQVELCGPVPHSVVPPVTVAEQRSHG